MRHLTDHEFSQFCQRLRNQISQVADNIGIVVVANAKTRTKIGMDHEAQSIKSEFFSDHEVQQLLADLRSSEIFVTPFYDENDFIHWILANGPHHLPVNQIIVYNAAQNGTGPGRKSLIPAFCSLHNIHTTGSNAYVVSLCRHKFHLNRLLRSSGISVPDSWWYLGDGKWVLNEKPSLRSNVIVKLTYESASMGLDEHSVGPWGPSLEDKAQYLTKAFQQPVLIQEFISGIEIETPIIISEDSTWSDILEIKVPSTEKHMESFLTYEMVYDDKYTFVELESSSLDRKLLREQGSFIAQLIGFRGISRVDYRVRDNKYPYVIDIATNPHLVEHSSVAHCLGKLNLSCKPVLLLVALKMRELEWI